MILSRTEVCLGDENGYSEGVPFNSLYGELYRKTLLTSQCKLYNKNCIITKDLLQTDDFHWWLRTPVAEQISKVYYIHASGLLCITNAVSKIVGLRPALNICSNISVSNKPDNNGAYIIEWDEN